MESFGDKVRLLRLEKGLSREEFCGDETELSVRQLARIESQQSTPNLSKAYFIADQLGVKLGSLTDSSKFVPPKRYKELKYLILRTPTYRDDERVQLKDTYFAEIYSTFYDSLPEEEQVVIECMRSKADVFVTKNVHFGVGLLDDYFEQVKLKKSYTFNDLIIIDLYLMCFAATVNRASNEDIATFGQLTKTLLRQEKYFSMEDIFILNNLLFNSISLLCDLKMWTEAESTFIVLKEIMSKTQDYHKKPVLSMLEWKYHLERFQDVETAEKLFKESILFAGLIGDTYLQDKLKDEWEKDAT